MDNQMLFSFPIISIQIKRILHEITDGKKLRECFKVRNEGLETDSFQLQGMEFQARSFPMTLSLPLFSLSLSSQDSFPAARSSSIICVNDDEMDKEENEEEGKRMD